jgi:hypothetical protein
MRRVNQREDVQLFTHLDELLPRYDDAWKRADSVKQRKSNLSPRSVVVCFFEGGADGRDEGVVRNGVGDVDGKERKLEVRVGVDDVLEGLFAGVVAVPG